MLSRGSRAACCPDDQAAARLVGSTRTLTFEMATSLRVIAEAAYAGARETTHLALRQRQCSTLQKLRTARLPPEPHE